MTEHKLLAPCVKLMRSELPTGWVVVKHADSFTSGWPDVSVTGLRRTTLWEFKHGPKVKWANALQQLTCRRLAAAGYSCLIVLYQETEAERRTVILTPDEVEVGATIGFSHEFVVNFVRNLHVA